MDLPISTPRPFMPTTRTLEVAIFFMAGMSYLLDAESLVTHPHGRERNYGSVVFRGLTDDLQLAGVQAL